MFFRCIVSLLFLLVGGAVSAQAQSKVPRSAYEFVNSIGVNTHFGYYDTTYGNYEEILKPRLLELGVKHIRDGTYNADVAKKYREVGQAGVRLLLITSADRAVQSAKTIGPMLWGLEAVNEPDGTHRDGQWVAFARDAQRKLYEAVKQDPDVKHIPVVGLSLANIKDSPSRLGDISQWMDYGGMHPYAAGQYPSKHWGWGMSMNDALQEARKVSQQKPMLVTECGYHNKENNPNHPGVSERAAAIYHLHLFFIYFNQGIERCYKYEFLDLNPDPQVTDMECHFGLVRADGSVKPSFTAIKNLLALLSDDVADVKCKPLNYEVVAPEGVNVRTTLLQKSDGSWWLALMREVDAYDNKQLKDVEVPLVDVEVRFERALNANTYLPNYSTSVVKKFSKKRVIKIPLGAEVQLVELRN